MQTVSLIQIKQKDILHWVKYMKYKKMKSGRRESRVTNAHELIFFNTAGK